MCQIAVSFSPGRHHDLQNTRLTVCSCETIGMNCVHTRSLLLDWCDGCIHDNVHQYSVCIMNIVPGLKDKVELIQSFFRN